jgi:hypothetical protein
MTLLAHTAAIWLRKASRFVGDALLVWWLLGLSFRVDSACLTTIFDDCSGPGHRHLAWRKDCCRFWQIGKTV